MDKSADAGELSARRRFVEVLQAEVGDVDITKEDVLVSVGRGIGDKENIPMADELAKPWSRSVLLAAGGGRQVVGKKAGRWALRARP